MMWFECFLCFLGAVSITARMYTRVCNYTITRLVICAAKVLELPIVSVSSGPAGQRASLSSHTFSLSHPRGIVVVVVVHCI